MRNFWKRFPRRSLRALRLRIGALWHTKGVHLEIIKIWCKTFLLRKFLKAIPTALTQSLKAWDWRPLAYERKLSRNYKIAGKDLLCRKFLKAIPTALTQSLKAWDWRPLACERKLCRNYTIAGKIFCVENFWKRFPRRSLRALRIAIGALWHTKGSC